MPSSSVLIATNGTAMSMGRGGAQRTHAHHADIFYDLTNVVAHVSTCSYIRHDDPTMLYAVHTVRTVSIAGIYKIQTNISRIAYVCGAPNGKRSARCVTGALHLQPFMPAPASHIAT